MKIEIGESILASYLKHVRGCQLVQTNFKASPSWETYNQEIADKLFMNAVSYFNTDDGKTIKGSGMSQFLGQAEIDVLGFDFASNNIIAADVAFHESGLNYGSKEETEQRVIKKTIRTALCLIYYFNKLDGEIIFAAPKTHGTFMSDKILQEINKILTAMDLHFEIKLLCNEEFTSEIFDKVMASCGRYSDTSELFVRAAQLIKLMESKKIKTPVYEEKQEISVQKSSLQTISTDDPYPRAKIGEIANNHLRSELQKRIIPQNELENLQDLRLCKEYFGLSYPILSKNPIIEKGRYRTYSNHVFTSGQTFYITNHWLENSRKDLIIYIEQILKRYPERD